MDKVVAGIDVSKASLDICQGQSLSAYSVSRIMTLPKVVDTSP